MTGNAVTCDFLIHFLPIDPFHRIARNPVLCCAHGSILNSDTELMQCHVNESSKLVGQRQQSWMKENEISAFISFPFA
jgi:hypothetical protein